MQKSGLRLTMKTLILIGADDLGARAWRAARADLTIVQKVEGMGQDMENTSRFKAGKTRVDTSPGTSLIMDLKTGEMINLMHAPKTLHQGFQRDGAGGHREHEAVAGRHCRKRSPRSPPPARRRRSAVSPADEYTCTVAGVKMTLWLTRALPDYAGGAQGDDRGVGPGSDGAAHAKLRCRSWPALPGFPIRTVLEIQPGQTMTRTVVSVSTKPVRRRGVSRFLPATSRWRCRY